MSAYADTGFLCSLYTPDAHTERAARYMARKVESLPLTWLHRLEFRNALHLRVFRKEITRAQRDASLNLMLADAASGVLIRIYPAMDAVQSEAERLSAQYSEHLGTRSLDILHVASALVLGLPEFITFDHRQGSLAKAAGLKVPAL